MKRHTLFNFTTTVVISSALILPSKLAFANNEGHSSPLPVQRHWVSKGGKWYFTNDNLDYAKGLQFIGNSWYYFSPTSYEMQTGWIQENNLWFYFDSNGARLIGWHSINNNWYYFDKNTGAMATGLLTLDGKTYNLSSTGQMLTGWHKLNDKWFYFDDIDGYSVTNRIVDNYYINADGSYTTITSDMTHSQLQYNLFKYISNYNNGNSVLNTAINLHNGELENNCVYFQSEALRRVGVNIPTYICNTSQLECQLNSKGWKKCYDLNQLKPGDIVFSGPYHVFTFLHWAEGNYAFIADNQRKKFGKVTHKRNIFSNDFSADTYKATHFYSYSY